VKLIVGIDNGVTGSIGFAFSNGELDYYPMPTKKILNYTKKKSWVNIIDVPKLKELLLPVKKEVVLVLVERPMLNPRRFKASISAIRALQAVEGLLIDEMLPYKFLDSKEWQKVIMFPRLKGTELKKASDAVAKRYLPEVNFKNGSGDGLLIAVYGRLKFFEGELDKRLRKV